MVFNFKVFHHSANGAMNRHFGFQDTLEQKMKKYLSVVIIAIFMISIFSGCGNNGQTAEISGIDNDRPTIVTTIFPEYDWVRNVVGESSDTFDIKMLLGSGVDLHSYQPTAEDMATISKCDMFVYVGGESNRWVTDALKEAENSDMIVIDLLDVLGDRIKEEELVEGMQEEAEHEHPETAADIAAALTESGEEDEGPEIDVHVWLSLKNAKLCVSAIEEAVSTLDPDGSETYEANAKSYIEKLDALDRQYSDVVSAAETKTILFGDRFPFRYLVDDYGIEYYAAFVGCSAETEASFETIIFLAEKINELDLHCVFTIENSDQKIAKTIMQNTKSRDQKILTLDSMQSVTSWQIENGENYLSIMESNLKVLTEALG